MKQKLKKFVTPVVVNFFVVGVALAANPPAPTLNQYSCRLFNWSQYIIIPIVTVIFIIAGVAYMTSGGNPSRTAFAKKLITGGVSAILVLYLSEFFLRYVVGVPWPC